MNEAWITTINPVEAEGELLNTYQDLTGVKEKEKISRRIRNNFIALSLRPNLMSDAWNFMHKTSFKNESSN